MSGSTDNKGGWSRETIAAALGDHPLGNAMAELFGDELSEAYVQTGGQLVYPARAG